MASFSGTFQLTGGRGVQSGPCALSFDKDTLQLVSGGAPVLACDLGDIDVFAPGDCILDLTFFTGQQLRLQQFGKAFDNLVHDLLEAYRARLVKCLLLDDLEEVSRFTGTVEYRSPVRSFSGPSEIRLYQSNLAVLPLNATGFQWRLVDIDALQFDADAYATVLRSRDEMVKVTKLAKRTDEFRQRVEAAIQQVGERSAKVLHELFPFVAPDRFAEIAGAMKEGHPVSLGRLKTIDTRTCKAVVSNVIDAKLRPYFEALAKLAGEGGTFAGFKIIRPEDAPESGEGAEDEGETDGSRRGTARRTPTEGRDDAEEPAADTAADSGDETGGEDAEAQDQGEEQPVLHWFFFRITPPAAKEPVLAWEATSRSGRATYVFRESALVAGGASGSPDAAADRLARGLAFVNFRREPIYLADDALQLQPKFRRYAIASRRLPELADLRRAFAGRAIHTSLDAWQKQMDSLLKPA
jgi:hypothetical protein